MSRSAPRQGRCANTSEASLGRCRNQSGADTVSRYVADDKRESLTFERDYVIEIAARALGGSEEPTQLETAAGLGKLLHQVSLDGASQLQALL